MLLSGLPRDRSLRPAEWRSHARSAHWWWRATCGWRATHSSCPPSSGTVGAVVLVRRQKQHWRTEQGRIKLFMVFYLKVVVLVYTYKWFLAYQQHDEEEGPEFGKCHHGDDCRTDYERQKFIPVLKAPLCFAHVLCSCELLISNRLLANKGNIGRSTGLVGSCTLPFEM